MLIDINNNSKVLNNNNYMELSMQQGETAFVRVYPINSNVNCIPYVVKIKQNAGNVTTNQTCAKVFKLNNIYEIHLVPFKINKNNIATKQKLNIGTVANTVYISNNEVLFENNDGLANVKIAISDAEIKTLNNSICVHGKLDNNGEVCVIYNTELNKINELYGTQIEVDEDCIKVLKKHPTIIGHVTLKEYIIENNILTLRNEELYYQNEQQKSNIANEIIPLAFLQAISVKDFISAKRYLSQNLNEILTAEKLESFFGEFQSIQMSVNSSNVYNVYTQENCKQFAFTMSGGVITDIEDI